MIVLKGKKGASFEYRPQTNKVTYTQWTEKKPSKFATISFGKQNRWLLKDSNFFFLMETRGLLSYMIQTLLPEGIVRASVISLPEGTHHLFGYRVVAPKPGGTITFLHGKVIKHENYSFREVEE